VNAIYWWAPLTHPADRAPAMREADVPRRVRIVADAYDMSKAQRAVVVPTALRRAGNSIPAMRAAAEADPVFRRWWDGGLHDKLLRAERWLAAEADRLTAALTD
jgi:hypothetical protein